MSTANILLIVLGILTLAFVVVFVQDLIKHKDEILSDKNVTKNAIISSIIGFIVNFFDTLGIGSFAPATALLRAAKQTEDRVIPGTLNVSCVLPVVFEAFLFIQMVEVEPITLATLLVAAVAGAYLGAGIVSKLHTNVIRISMAIALFITGVILVLQLRGIFPSGGDAVGLTGIKLVIGIVVNFILGALMTAGIGLYAPCMALVYLLGMSPLVAFPIMMGSSAYLMPVASLKFIKEGAYNRKASLAIAIFGIFGVFIGYRFIKMLNLNALKFIIIIVMAYSAVSLFYSAYKDSTK